MLLVYVAVVLLSLLNSGFCHRRHHEESESKYFSCRSTAHYGYHHPHSNHQSHRNSRGHSHYSYRHSHSSWGSHRRSPHRRSHRRYPRDADSPPSYKDCSFNETFSEATSLSVECYIKELSCSRHTYFKISTDGLEFDRSLSTCGAGSTIKAIIASNVFLTRLSLSDRWTNYYVKCRVKPIIETTTPPSETTTKESESTTSASTSTESTTILSTSTQLTTAVSTSIESTTMQSTMPASTSTESTTMQSTSTESTMTQPMSTESTTVESTSTESASTDSTTIQSTSTESTTVE